jgi:hypothetical protein
MKNNKFENELFFDWIDDLELKNKLTYLVKESIKLRKREGSQQLVTDYLDISLTKVKQIENGTCVDFNAINNYINFYQHSL